MKLLEPVTTVTDYILAVETLVFGILLLRDASAFSQLSGRLLAFLFFSTAVAAAAGGTYHGFLTSLQPATTAALWKITVLAVGVTTLLMLSSTAFSTLTPPTRTLLLAGAILQFLVYAIWMAGQNEFKYVIWNYATAMLVALILHSLNATRNNQGSGWIATGIAVSFIAAGAQRSGLNLHRHFNHNDLYHVIQMAAMYLIYRGGVLLRDTPMRILT